VPPAKSAASGRTGELDPIIVVAERTADPAER
jgi:hypothetical protein